MTVGFKQAGIKPVLSTDIEQSACLTLKVNNPETTMLCDDVTQSYIKEHIIETALENSVDLICGVYRAKDSQWQGVDFQMTRAISCLKTSIDIVERVQPKIVIFENV